MERIFRDKEKLGHPDLESTEISIRHSMHRVGGVFLEKLLNADGGDHRGTRISCRSGHDAEFVDYRTKEVTTVLSPVEIRRACYHCQECQQGILPKDRGY